MSNHQPAPARRRAVAIFGPTSSGKTAASLDLAEALRDAGMRPVVLNADSRQVYRGMDIGTSKIRPRDMRGVEHRLLDVSTPDRAVALEEYAALADRVLAEVLADAAAVPILVGGTGTYLKAVVEGWALSGSASRRRALEKDFPPNQVGDAFDLLCRIDASAASKVHPNNHDAILNALARRTGDADHSPTARPFSFTVFCMRRDIDDLAARIEGTLDAQLRAGLFEEVSSLAAQYGLIEQLRKHGKRARNVVLHTHGYREFLERSVSVAKPLRSFTRVDIEITRTAILDHIWAYARRQRGWYSKLRHRTLRPDAASARAVAAAVVGRRRS